MAAMIVTALDTFIADLTTVSTEAVAIGASCLLVWLGWRMACKIPNRAVGK